MKLISLQCPSCGGSFQLDPSNKTFAFCAHCGTKVLIDDEIKRTEHKEIKIDKAHILEIETAERLRLKELEIQDQERKLRRKKHKAYLISTLVILAITLVVGSIGYITYNNFLMDLGLFLLPVLAISVLVTYYNSDAYYNEAHRWD